MAGTYTKLLYHVVFSTKGRTPFITSELAPRLHEYLGGIIRSEKGIAYQIGRTIDHVRLLIRWRADGSLATLMRNLKSHSSRWIHQTFQQCRAFQWREGYAAFTVSESQSEAVNRYILNQEDHHRQKTFVEEFVGLLKAHGIEYDQRLASTGSVRLRRTPPVATVLGPFGANGGANFGPNGWMHFQPNGWVRPSEQTKGCAAQEGGDSQRCTSERGKERLGTAPKGHRTVAAGAVRRTRTKPVVERPPKFHPPRTGRRRSNVQ